MTRACRVAALALALLACRSSVELGEPPLVVRLRVDATCSQDAPIGWVRADHVVADPTELPRPYLVEYGERPRVAAGASYSFITLDPQPSGFSLPTGRGGMYLASGGQVKLCTAAGACTDATAPRAPSGAAGGDLGGTYPNPTVARINGGALGTTTPSNGNLLIGSGTAWVTRAVSGDLTLDAVGATAVTKLRGTAVSASAPNDGELLGYSASGTTWRPTTLAAVAASIPIATGFYGTGADGACVLDGTNTFAWASKSGSVYTTTREVNCASMSVAAGVTLTNATSPYAIRVRGTLTIAATGSVNSDGASAGGSSRGTDPGTALQLGLGQAGQNGQTTSGSNVGNTAAGFAGGSGGTGGDGAGGRTGATGGVAQAPSSNYGSPGLFTTVLTGWLLNTSPTAGLRVNGGGAGGAGAGDGAANGGASGNGGGVLILSAHTIANSGTISANGGAGSTSTGNTGGGGGGGGGYVGLTYRSYTGNAATANGGAGGAGAGTGTNGTAGAAGVVYTQVM